MSEKPGPLQITQAEARRFLKGKLDTDRTSELGDIMRQAGLPI